MHRPGDAARSLPYAYRMPANWEQWVRGIVHASIYSLTYLVEKVEAKPVDNVGRLQSATKMCTAICDVEKDHALVVDVT